MEPKRHDNHAHITHYPLGYAHQCNEMYAAVYYFFVLDGQTLGTKNRAGGTLSRASPRKRYEEGRGSLLSSPRPCRNPEKRI